MTVTMDRDDCVITDRGGIVENRHRVHAAVVDASGRLLYSLGDPERVTLIRSAAKPAQALAVAGTGALEHFGLDEADLALACASHNAEDRHVARVRAILARVPAAEADLRCGPHEGMTEAMRRRWARAGLAPTAVCNNCSAKHACFLAAARVLGAEPATYHHPDHPVQVRVRRAVEHMTRLAPEEVLWAVDGCNAPTPAVPLRNLGLMYALLADAADQVKEEGEETVAVAGDIGDDKGAEEEEAARTRNVARIFRAMSRHPEMIAGDDRFCTDLTRAFGGALVGKVGADGCYAIAVRASDSTRRLGAAGALGIAIKIEDGNLDMLYASVMEIMQRLDIGTPDVHDQLAIYHNLDRVNSMGIVIGHVSFSFNLQEHQAILN